MTPLSFAVVLVGLAVILVVGVFVAAPLFGTPEVTAVAAAP